MSKYTREECLQTGHVTEEEICVAERDAKSFVTGPMFVVFRWDLAPESIRKLCCYNGGDEDWMIIVKSSDDPEWIPNWLEHTDSCYEPDVYVLDGVVIYVGSHA
jgi:hypothetical protein